MKKKEETREEKEKDRKRENYSKIDNRRKREKQKL
jgi:hypothetical protein